MSALVNSNDKSIVIKLDKLIKIRYYFSSYFENEYLLVIIETISLQVNSISNLILDAVKLIVVDLLMGNEEVPNDLSLLLGVMGVVL